MPNPITLIAEIVAIQLFFLANYFQTFAICTHATRFSTISTRNSGLLSSSRKKNLPGGS